MPKTSVALLLILAGLAVGGASQLVISGATATVVPIARPTPPPIRSSSADEPKERLHFNLVPPATGATNAEWLAFAHQVHDTETGSQHDNSDYTTPLLPWYAYIARQNPHAIYTLYQERNINDRIMGHLIQFGLLPQWYEEMEGAQKLLLSEPAALINLAVQRGSDFARAELISLLRNGEAQRGRVGAGPLLFAISGMRDDEIDKLLTQLGSGALRLDPRSLRTLMQEPRVESRESEMLAILRVQAQRYGSSSSRSMSSYFLHGAELGAQDYVSNLVADVQDNDGQPTNFYCAACYLALVSDGMVGKTLTQAVQAGRTVAVADYLRDGRSGHEYQLSLVQGGRP